jgi:hypothetical protein
MHDLATDEHGWTQIGMGSDSGDDILRRLANDILVRGRHARL